MSARGIVVSDAKKCNNNVLIIAFSRFTLKTNGFEASSPLKRRPCCAKKRVIPRVHAQRGLKEGFKKEFQLDVMMASELFVLLRHQAISHTFLTLSIFLSRLKDRFSCGDIS